MDAITERTVRLNVCVLEDVPELLEDVTFNVASVLRSALAPRTDESRSYEVALPLIEPVIVSTDNIATARDYIRRGVCDLLVADLKVKESQQSPREGASCLPLLREIKRQQLLTPVLVHSVHRDLLDAVVANSLAVSAISKLEKNSVSTLAGSCGTVATSLAFFKQKLLAGLKVLAVAAFEPSPIAQQAHLRAARKLFADVVVPSFAPPAYRRSVATLVPVLFRVSSVGSPVHGLRQLSIEFVDKIEEIIARVVAQRLSFEKDAQPLFKALEAAGYEVFTRFDDEGQ